MTAMTSQRFQHIVHMCVSFNAFGADQRHESQYKHGKYTDQNAPALQWRHNERDGVSKSPAARLFTQPFIQAQIKENKEAPRHWPLCGEFTGDRWIPRTNGQ